MDRTSDDNHDAGVHKAVKLLNAIINSNADHEKLKRDSNSLEEDDDFIQENIIGRETHYDLLGNDLSENIFNTIDWLRDREENRNRTMRSNFLNSVDDHSISNEDMSQICIVNENTDDAMSDDAEAVVDDNSKDSGKYKFLKTKFQCRVCGKFLCGSQSLARHKLTHLDENDPEQAKMKRPLSCKVCGKSFGLDTLRVHMRTHADEADPCKKKFKCEICGKFLSGYGPLNLHKRTHLDGNDPEQAKMKKPFGCEDCGKTFSQVGHLRVHKKVHADDETVRNPHQCKVCGKRITDLRGHMKTHLADESREKFECDTCGRKFCTRHALLYHKQNHLGDNDAENAELLRPHECEECGKKFRTPMYLKIHMRLHNDNDYVKKPYSCDECGKRFTQSSNLNTHKKIHIPEAKRDKFECDVCGKNTSTIQALSKHMLTHLDDNDPEQSKTKRPFICEECGKAYTRSSDLQKHMRIHADDESKKKPHKCETCGKRFTQKIHLDMHSNVHLPDDDPRKEKYKCEECGKTYNSGTSLKRHQLTHQSDYQKVELERLFKCDDCGKAFHTEQILNKHVRTHSDDETVRKPHVCSVCGKRFSKIGDHMKSHLPDDDPNKHKYKCEICGKTYFSSSSLNNHRNKH